MSDITLTLPDVGEGLHEAEIVRWLVEPQQAIVRDQPLVEVETDKSVVEIPAPADGVVLALHVTAGEVISVGTALATITPTEGTIAPDIHTDRTGRHDATGSASTVVPDAPGTQGTQGGTRPAGKVRASPATRRAALTQGVDLTTVRGHGPGGRITAEDLRRHLEAGSAGEVGDQTERVRGPSPVPDMDSPEEPTPLRGVRRRIAEQLTQSWRNTPHITDMRELPADGLVAAHTALASGTDRRLTYLPLLVAIVASALEQHPWMNATVDADASHVTVHRTVNIGIATATDDGLLVPVVTDVGVRKVLDLAEEIDRLVTGARNRSLSPAESRGGTFTVSNSGSFGGWLGTPIIRPPEVAIAMFGRIQDRVVAVDGQPAVRPVLPVSVSADHRVVDGDHLGRFMLDLARLVADPILLLRGGQW